MPRRKTNTSELRRYFTEWLDTGFQADLVTRHRREAVVRAMSKHLPGLTEVINTSGKGKLPLGRATTLQVYLREGRDPARGRFNLFELRWSRSKRPTTLRCFLGHRFTKSISDSLRHNLRYILEPSNIKLVWSGMDMQAVGFFDDIVKKIQRCDFCIFDNRSTDRKPNVYIEAGIAYVLRRPFILANHVGNRVGVPSDLSHILNIPYTNYSDLTRRLYFNLPVFLSENHLRRTR